MNVIINGFYEKNQIEVINKLVEKNSFDYIYHISSDRAIIKSSSSKIVIESNYFYNIGHGNYDFSGFSPLDKEIIEKMMPYESIIIKMMDRLDLYSNNGYSKYKKRYELYLKHLRYWNNIIKRKNINLFINQSIPHEVYDYVIYALCKINNIPTLFFFQSQMHDTTIVLSEIDNWGKNINLEYSSLIEKNKSILSNNIILDGNALKEWLLRKEDKLPFYMYEKTAYPLKIISGNKNRLKKLINPLRTVSFIYFLINKKIKNTILNLIYFYLSSSYDQSKKFIYFPLHLQPEMTTCPLGGVIDDQRIVIEMIANSLPENVFLYIKENPKQEYFCRDFNYYKNILKLNKKIVFISKNVSTYDLIEKSIAVATFTGTAGWEALFKKRPVLVFGDCFYDSAPGSFKIKSNQDCFSAIDKIVNKEFVYNEKELKLFLQAVSNTSLNCCTDAAYFCISSASIEENNNIFLNFLYNYLESNI